MMIEDSVILNSIRNNKPEGIHLLFDRYYRPLVLYADEFLKDQATAEDLVQELFLKLWEGDYLLEVSEKNLATYLFSAIRNKCRTYFEKKDVLQKREMLEDVDIPVEMVVRIDEERMDIVMKEVNLLPERTRQIVECIMLRNLKYKEAAEELHISVNTVKFLLNKGIVRLRERLAHRSSEILLFFLRRLHLF